MDLFRTAFCDCSLSTCLVKLYTGYEVLLGKGSRRSSYSFCAYATFARASFTTCSAATNVTLILVYFLLRLHKLGSLLLHPIFIGAGVKAEELLSLRVNELVVLHKNADYPPVHLGRYLDDVGL